MSGLERGFAASLQDAEVVFGPHTQGFTLGYSRTVPPGQLGPLAPN